VPLPSLHRRRRIALAGLALVSIALPSSADGPERVLHRAIPGDLPIESRTDGPPLQPPSSSQGIAQSAGAASAWRDHQAVDDSVTRPRESWETPTRELDRDTRSPPGASLRYEEVFTPSVTPFKRLQAYDVVDESGRLTVRDPSLRPVDMGEGPMPARWNRQATARFVGDLNVQVSPQWPTPIPSVAGDQRVVSYTTSSSHAVEFVQDGAGNLFVRGTEAETVRLTYVLEAPQSAFTAPFVPSEPLDRAAAEVPVAMRPSVPTWLQGNADAVLRAAGVSRYQSLHAIVSGLVAYFRSFRDDDLPANANGQSLYADLALNRVGACRHRAYAFVLTMHALGLEARYVGNEAHAWAEVNFRSGDGWSRIDLGGWDIPLDAQAPSDRPQFHPSNEDPFPRPQAYESQYSARAAANPQTNVGEPTTTGGSGPAVTSAGSGALPSDGQGDDSSSASASSASGAGANASANAAGGVESPQAAANANGASGAAGTNAQAPGANASGAGVVGAAASGSNEPNGPRGASGVSVAPVSVNPVSGAEDDEPVRSVLGLGGIEADPQAGYAVGPNGFVRGTVVIVRGDLHDPNGNGLGALPVDIQLVRDRRVVAVIGRTVTQPDGRWEAHAQIPNDLPTGEYTLRASTSGDRSHTSATAE
jgi:transglutaminase-like putative cysteine protease